MKYDDALKYDKRNYSQYYMALIKYKQLIIFTFYTYQDYNSKTIKIYLFFFLLAFNLTINALFLYDSTMHKIYIDQGKFDFIYNLPKMILSSLISSIIKIIINYLSLTEKSILGLKKDLNEIKNNLTKLFEFFIVKFIILFALAFAFLLFFWFYISCFCYVYNNTQIHLIKDTLISFGISLLFPFGASLLPVIFRIPALRAEKHNQGCIYDISKILQLI